MAITTVQIDALPDYSDANIVKMLKQAIIAVSTGQTVMMNGHTVSRANLKDLRETLAFFEERANAEDDSGGIALAQYGERT